MKKHEIIIGNSYIIHNPFPLQLVDMMGTLLHRPLIHEKFKNRYPVITKMVDNDLNAVKKLYDHQITSMQGAAGPQLNKNMPKVAGLLRWSQELRERVNLSVDKLRALNHG